MKSLKKVAAPAPISGDRTIRFDAFLSHKRSDAQDTAARVDKLTDLGYRAFIDRNDLVELASLKLAVRDTATFVCFLTPNYFKSAWCCLEICQAVESGVNVLFVQMEGCAFPSPSDVPETMVVHDEEDITLKPREAYQSDRLGRTDLHSKAFFGTCIEGMQAALSRRRRRRPRRRGQGHVEGGRRRHDQWEKVRAQLKKAAARATLTVRRSSRRPASPPSTTAARPSRGRLRGALLGGTKFELVDALSGGASAKASAEEKLVPVKIVPEAEGAEEIDSGLALVGPGTSLEEVRAQLRETYEEERADDELPSHFTFLATDAHKAVKRKQKKLIRGRTSTARS